MPLSPEQQARLAHLESRAQPSGLSPEKQARLAELEAKAGPSLLDRALSGFEGVTPSGVDPLPQDPADRAGYMKAHTQAAIAAATTALPVGEIAGPVARGLANFGVGGVQGAALAPEGQRMEGAVKSGLANMLLGTGGPAALRAGATSTGKVLGGLSKGQTAAYVENPSYAEGLQEMPKLAWERRAKNEIDLASRDLQQQFINPRKTVINHAGTNKTYRINTGDLEGTEAYPHVQDAWAKQGQTAVEKDPLTGAPVQTSMPAPMPKSLGLTLEQLLRSKRAAGQAADFAFSKNPLGMTAADNAVAKANAGAAHNLGESLKGNTGPEYMAAIDQLGQPTGGVTKILRTDVGQVYDELSEALNKKEQLSRINPTSIYQATDNAAASNPMPALREFFDQNAGSQFGHDADALQAARSLQGSFNPIQGKKTLPAPVARGLLKGVNATAGMSQGLQSTPGAALPLLQMLGLDDGQK